MRLLVIELTSDLNSIALCQDDAETVIDSWETAHLRRQQVFTRTTTLLKSLGLEPRDLDAIAVDVGPGSYFGLRVAYTYALGLAFLDGIPITGATSCEILAWERLSDGHSGPVATLHDIRRGHLALSTYASSRQLLDQQSPDIRVIEPAELAASLPPRTTILTPDWARLGASVLKDIMTTHHVIPNATYPTASALGGLVMERSRQGHPLHPVSPLYLHPPVVTTNAHQPADS